jgi:hypothetical protein
VIIYMEGGGDHNKKLKMKCRVGLIYFLEKTNLLGHMPIIKPCGGRKSTFDSYCAGLKRVKMQFY